VFEIRHVQPQDIFSVISLAFETLPERYNPTIFNQFYESSPEGFFIAEQHHIIIGYLIGIKPVQGSARILMLSVKPHYQRHGVGSALLNAFLNEMKTQQITYISLEVRTTNTTAIRFYEHHGFVIKDTLIHFYQNGENAYHMDRIISA